VAGTRTGLRSGFAPFGGFGSSPTNFRFLSGAELSAGAAGFYTGVIGDYDSNGRKDVATVVSSDYGSTFSLSVMLGNGDGTFGAAVLTPISFASTDRVYAADLNQDRNDEIVIVRKGSLDVFIGKGDGTFASPVNYPDGIGIPAAVLLGDLDGDGQIDLMVTDGVSAPDDPTSIPMVSTYLGIGDGTFQPMTQTALPGQLPSGVFADVDNDGILDLVGATQVFLGSGLGKFQPEVDLKSSNGQPNSCSVMDGTVVVADMDSDGLPDIVTADCQNNTVTVYLNTGGGNFQPGTSYWAGAYPQGVGVTDVDHDGKFLDIVAINAESCNLTVLLNLGGGNFQVPESGYAVDGFGWLKPLIADFDGDGIADVLVANYVPEFQFTLTLLHAAKSGIMSAAADYFAKPSPGSFAFGTGIASGDFNGDGKPDFVRGNAGNSGAGVTVFIANPDGTMQTGVNYDTASFNYVGTGDFNADRNQDVVAVDASGNVDWFPGNGDGTFKAAQPFPALAGPAEGLVVGDFDQANGPDVAVTGSARVAVLLNNGSGGFQAAASYGITSDGVAIATADLDNDGNLDLVLPQANSSLVSILMGTSKGAFKALKDVDLGFSFPQAIVIGDLNGDGIKDLAVTIDDFSASMGIAVALGNGNGAFQAGTLYASTTLKSPIGPPFPGGVQILDLDGDGNMDLIYDNSEYETVGVLFGQGKGTFLAPVETPVGGYPVDLVLADVDGDGSQDVVTSMLGFPGITVLLNTSGSSVSVNSTLNPADVNQTFVLTANVLPVVGGVTNVPTGTLTFTEGATVLGTGTLSGGFFAVALSESTLGDHVITATYSGDASFMGSTINFTQTISSGGGIGRPNYILSANPLSAVLKLGQSANFAITVSPTDGFNGTVDFTCGTLPAGISCQFTPLSVTPTNGPVQVQLVVNTAAIAASAAPVESNPGRKLPLLASITAGFFGLVLADGLGRKRGRATIVVLAIFALATLLSTVGCGGSSATASHAANSHTVHVVASNTGSGGGGTHQLDISITIQE
jgi:hypothetical protein